MATEHLHCLDPEQFLAARIVAVDDQPGNIRLLEALLGEAGYRHLTGLTDPTLVLETWTPRTSICSCSTCACRCSTGCPCSPCCRKKSIATACRSSC